MTSVIGNSRQFAADLYEAARKDLTSRAARFNERVYTAVRNAPVIRQTVDAVHVVAKEVRDPSYGSLEKQITNLESMLNKVDLIPVASILSGWFRMGIGIIELVAFSALSFIKDIGTAFVTNEETLARLRTQSTIEFGLAKNGVANIVRGLAVSSSSMNPVTIALHKLAILVYDRVVKARYVYPHEEAKDVRFKFGLSRVKPAVTSVNAAPQSYKDQLWGLFIASKANDVEIVA